MMEGSETSGGVNLGIFVDGLRIESLNVNPKDPLRAIGVPMAAYAGRMVSLSLVVSSGSDHLLDHLAFRRAEIVSGGACRDSDGGEDKDVKGTVTWVLENIYGAVHQKDDHCIRDIFPWDAGISNYLSEAFCRDGIFSEQFFLCDGLCYDGECVKIPDDGDIILSDPDGGQKPHIKSTVMIKAGENMKKEITDSCFFQGKRVQECGGEGCFLDELYLGLDNLGNPTVKALNVECTNCRDGECLDIYYVDTDSNSLIPETEKGSVMGCPIKLIGSDYVADARGCSMGRFDEATDWCVDENLLIEYSLDSESSESINVIETEFDCRSLYSDGKCVEGRCINNNAVCEIISAEFSSESAYIGSVMGLNVKTSNCAGEVLSLKIYDSKVREKIDIIVGDSGSATELTTAFWTPVSKGRYLFEAKSGDGRMVISDNALDVKPGVAR